jgi:serine/threonine protein kinase/Flp pilus assembly protein TadD
MRVAGPDDVTREGANGSAGDRTPGAGSESVTEVGPIAAWPPEGPGGFVGPRVPGYEVIGKLGQGGMGVVYKARQLGLNRLVALKMIIGGQQARPDLLARFRVEAEAVARLRHPNILQIYDIGEVDGSPFVSLELLEGGDLADRLAGTPQPGLAAAELLATLARAVHAAHEDGIIHRDLKPANVLFTAEGVPKITDFGLAKRLGADSGHTQTGQVMGSPSYLAPEQAQGHTRDVGPAADVYALGAILYEMLTGRPPFRGESTMETICQVVSDDPVPPSRLVPRVARDLETICLKCLSKEPHRRYASALELAEDLDRYRRGETIRARRTPVWERGIKWSRRRPVAAVALVIGLAGSLGLIAWAIARERAERHRIERLDRQFVSEHARGLEACDLTDKALKADSRDDLEKAQGKLGTFHPDVASDPRLAPIRDRADDKRRAVAHRLLVLGSLEADRDRFLTFQRLHQEAQLFAVGLGVLESSVRGRRLRDAAQQALAQYAGDPRAPVDAWTLTDALPRALSDAQRAAIREGCYDLLLILSQAAEQPAEGLRLLDRAARLRPETTAAYHLRRADCLERAGDPAGRDRERRAAAAIKPATAPDYLLQGRELAWRRDFAAAIRSLNRAIELDPAQTSVHLLLAVCDLNVLPKRPGEARTSLNACIGRHPDLVGLYLLRALASGEEGLRSAGPEAAESFDAAESDYRRALELKPGDDLRYALLANRGQLRSQSGRLDEAVSDLGAAIAIRPDQHHAHTTLGQVLQGQGRLDEAAVSYGRAIACRPPAVVLAGLHRNRALLRATASPITAEHQSDALEDFDESIRLEPDPARRAGDHVWRARLFFRANRSAEALAACDLALKLVPHDPEAHRVRIAALMDLKRYDEVLASADAYLATGRPIVEVIEIRGLARRVRKDPTGAIGDFSRALELVPAADRARRSRLLNERGWAYQYAKAPLLALADFQESLRLEPEQAEAHGGRGLARILLGHWREAVDDAEAAVRHVQGSGSLNDEARDLQIQSLFNAARIHALAVEFAAREVSRQGERAVTLYRRHRSRAIELLDAALAGTPDPARRAEILADPALRRLRHGSSRSSDTRQVISTSDRRTSTGGRP